MIQVHHFFSEVLPNLERLLPRLIWRKVELLPDEKSHGLGTQRESSQKKKSFFSDDFAQVKDPRYS